MTRAIVIGAGIGGLTAAVLLAARGIDVTVLERAATPGGKMRQIAFDGAPPIDTGPTVFTMRWVFDEIFAAAGGDFGDCVPLLPVERLARHAWGAGGNLDLFADPAASEAAIGDFAGAADARGYRAFCAEARQAYETLQPSFLRNSKTNPLGLAWRIGLDRPAALLSIQPFKKLSDALAQHFRDPRLQQLFGRYATYSGSSPYRAPATLMLIAHVEAEGVWVVDGGMHQIAQAFERLASTRGARFRYGAEVRDILTANGRASGVRLADGEQFDADIVIANADPNALATGLFGDAARAAVRPTPRAKRSLSALTFTLAAKTSGFALLRHNVFFADNYAAEFADIFGRNRLPATPSVYVCAQDRESTHPPPEAAQGLERLHIITNAPASGDSHHFSPEESDQCATRTFALLARCGLQVERSPARCRATTPSDFNQLFPATGGALYGRASHGWAASFQRPGAVTAIPGLYLAGGATHPGAGVPMAALSGVQAANAALARVSMATSVHRAMAGGMSMRSAPTASSG